VSSDQWRGGPDAREHDVEVMKEVLGFDGAQVVETSRSGAFGVPTTAEGVYEEGRL
jgi:hypothetical protein